MFLRNRHKNTKNNNLTTQMRPIILKKPFLGYTEGSKFEKSMEKSLLKSISPYNPVV